MIPRAFEEVCKQDIDNLVAEGRAERRTLEYKQALPNLGLEQDKYEFLADVASFANASGGDILYGVVDKRDADKKPTGVPESAPGVAASNADAAIRQMEQVARANIDPRLPGFQARAVAGFQNGPVILVRVPRSFVSPHMVKNDKGWGRFYARGSAGKQILDVGEVRAAFALSASLPEKVRQFRAERISNVLAGETPAPLGPDPKVLLHVLPVSALDAAGEPLDLTPFQHRTVFPLAVSSPNFRFNIDGALYYKQGADGDVKGRPIGYVQLFRSGAIEAADSRLLRPRKADDMMVPITGLQRELVGKLGAYLKIQHELDLQPPVFVMLTLLGVKGYYVPYNEMIDESEEIDRDALFLPVLTVGDFAERTADVLRPAFDALWNAGGWPRCLLTDA